jgi:hypothetical protein
MTIIHISYTDPRHHKKSYPSDRENERAWQDFQYQHQVELKYEVIVRRDFLNHFYPTRAWDLMVRLKQAYLLGSADLSKIMKFLLHNDKFVEVEKIGEDERYWNLYLFPRTPNLIKYPHSFLPKPYYDTMRGIDNEPAQ